jgi:hypothetical protein
MFRRPQARIKMRISYFFRLFRMLLYPSVLLSAVYYATSFGYGSILFILTSSEIFLKLYKHEPWQTGVLLGVPLTVGSLLGELCSGYICDVIAERCAIAQSGRRRAENRLFAILPGAVLTPFGIIIEGVCITQKKQPFALGVGIAIATIGLQIVTTVVYTYTNHCYKPQAPEVGAILCFVRQIFSFCVGFYAVQLGEKIGFRNAWIAFAFVNVATFLPIIALMIVGKKWRVTLGAPKFPSES